MAVTIAIAVMTSCMRETASFGYIWARMVIRMSILSPVEGIFLGASCRYLFSVVQPVSFWGRPAGTALQVSAVSD